MLSHSHTMCTHHRHTTHTHITACPPELHVGSRLLWKLGEPRPMEVHKKQTLTHGVSLTPEVTSGVGRLAGPPEKRLYQVLLPKLML